MTLTFADEIDSLNSVIVSDNMVSLPYGRGYQFGGQSTVASVHVEAVMGSQYFPARLLEIFERRAACVQPDLYIGIGGALNLSYIASLKPKAAILVDINPVQRVFWKQVFQDMADCKDPSTFMRAAVNTESRVRAVLDSEPVRRKRWFDVWRSIDQTDGMKYRRSIFNLSYSFPDWLSSDLPDRRWVSEPYYSRLHDMAAEGRLAALTLDIADLEAVEQLKDAIGQRAMRAEFFHVSNVLDFMSYDHDWVGRKGLQSGLLRQAVSNIRLLALSDDTTLITDTKYLTLGEYCSLNLPDELSR